MFYDDNDSPGWAFLRIVFLGSMWFAAYQKGKSDAVHEIKHDVMEFEIADLRKKLAEQNRLNAMNRS